MKNLRVECYNAPWNATVEFLLMSRVDGKVFVARELEMKKADEAVKMEPTFSLERERAQQLMDSLWSCGLRPSEGTGSAGALAAVQAHLKDMQRLVFDGKPKQ